MMEFGRCTIIFVGLFLIAVCTCVGQRAEVQVNQVIFKKAYYGGGVIHTQGFGACFYQWKHKTYLRKRVLGVEVVGMRHLKEKKIHRRVDDNARGYSYGKLNSMFLVRLQWGYKKILFDKIRKKGVEISAISLFGPSIAFTKPEYLEIFHQYNGVGVVTEERYDPNEHFPSNIYGRAPWLTGLDELDVHPGGFAKLGLQFEHSSKQQGIKSVEVGAVLDAYPWKIPIMVESEAVSNNFLFGTLYIAVTFGKKLI